MDLFFPGCSFFLSCLFNNRITKIPEWVIWLEYLPFYAGLIWAALMNRKKLMHSKYFANRLI